MSDMFEHPLADMAKQGSVAKLYAPPPSRSTLMTAEKAEANATRPHVAAVAESYFEDPDRLHGDTVPDVTIQKERPIHRMMIWMSAQGASRQDIARQTGYSPQMVTTVLKQPWARQRLVQILKETGMDEVKHFLSHEVAPSLEVLREVRDGVIAGRTADRAAAANSILDRALGKPTVHVESDNTTRNVPADLQRLEAELATTRKQLEDRGQLDTSGSN